MDIQQNSIGFTTKDPGETEVDKEMKELLERKREEYKEKHGRYPEEDGISMSINK